MMSKHEEYHLAFSRAGSRKNNDIEYVYTTGGSINEDKIARKIQVLHKPECEDLITEIEAAQNGRPVDQYFSIDRSSATDDDHIQIFTTHISIDFVIVPLQDMKEILQEWLAFINSSI